MSSVNSLRRNLLQSTCGAAIVTATVLAIGAPARAQQYTVLPKPTTADTTPANVNVLNLLSPFLSLPSTPTGQATLQGNLNNAISINNNATLQQQQLAISDKSIFNNANNASLAASVGFTGNIGVAANLAGGLGPQTPINGITPQQPVGGYGRVLGQIYQTGVAGGTTGPLANTVNLLTSAYNTLTSNDLGVAKNYFANGAATNTSGAPFLSLPAVAPAGYTLPTANGLPNTTTSVLDIAGGVTATQPGQDIYGSSRPAQVAAGRINLFDPTALNGINTNPAFPSGHTTYAYTDSILLGMLTPQLFQSMLVRASEYGNSRIVLGVHYPLDIIGSRALSSYELAQAFTNPLYINNAAGTGAATTPFGVSPPAATGVGQAINLPGLFTAAQSELSSYLQQQGAAAGCGTTVTACANSAQNTANDPYVVSAANQALYRQRLTYGLPTLTFDQAPVEAAPVVAGPAGSPDASILLATVYGGSTTAAKTLAPTGGSVANLATSTINQIIVNTESNALAAFYGTQLSYWSRIDLYSAAGYFSGTNGTLTMASSDVVNTNVQVGNNNTSLTGSTALYMPNATLYGNGATFNGNLSVLSGSTFGGGSATATATTTINGNLTLQSGSFYTVTALNNALSSTRVSGTAAIGGSSVNSITDVQSAYALSYKTLPILTATTVNGQFQTVNLSNSVVATAVYKTNEVDLAITPNTLTSQAPTGLTSNQSRTSAGVDAVLATGRAPAQFVNLFNLSQSALPGTLNQLSGEVATSVVTSSLNAGNLFLGTLLDPNIEGRGTATGTPFLAMVPEEMQYQGQVGPRYTKGPAPLPVPQRSPWTVWATGTGLGADLAGDAARGTSRVTEQLGGISGGADWRGAPGLVLGFGIGGAETWAQVKNGLGSSRSDIFQVGVYGVQELFHTGYVAGAFAYSNADSRTNRAVNVGAINETLTGRPNTDLFSGRLEAGYRYAFGFGGLTPYAAIEVQNASTGGYSETSSLGVSAFGINYLSKENTNVRFEAGSRFDVAAGGFGSVFGRVAYVHQDVNPAVTGLFEGLSATAFTINGARLPRDAALVSLGTDMRLAKNVKLTAQAIGEIAEKSNTIAGRLTLRYEW